MSTGLQGNTVLTVDGVDLVMVGIQKAYSVYVASPLAKYSLYIAHGEDIKRKIGLF